MLQYKIETEIGALYLVASESALYGIYFRQMDFPMTSRPNALHKKAETQLGEYFAGKRESFDLPIASLGTTFQAKVWAELRKIPYGKTISYAELACRIKNPKAVRAVGAANGRNPLSIVVPCHRVIGTDGSLTGFAGGLDRKIKLLTLEKALQN